MIGNVDDPTEIKRYRDVIRKAGIHGDYVIIGVEHQSTFDKNMPNILARISKLFADHNLNIENMVNRSRGDYAYTLIDTNDDVRQDIIERIEAAEGIINVRVIK